MIEQEQNRQGAEVEKTTAGRVSHPPDTESCVREGGNGPAAEREKGSRNRTTRAKRRQGTLRAVRRSRTLLKRYSLVKNKGAGGDGVTKSAPKTTGTAMGEVAVGLSGSESMASRERGVRNLGRPLCLPGRPGAARGRSDQRKKTGRRVSRGESDRPTVGRGKRRGRPAATPEAHRRGRRNNAACNGNMSRWDQAGAKA